MGWDVWCCGGEDGAFGGGEGGCWWGVGLGVIGFEEGIWGGSGGVVWFDCGGLEEGAEGVDFGRHCFGGGLWRWIEMWLMMARFK